MIKICRPTLALAPTQALAKALADGIEGIAVCPLREETCIKPKIVFYIFSNRLLCVQAIGLLRSVGDPESGGS